MSEDWQEYSRGPQNSGENSPVLRTGVSGQRGPGRKETGTRGHNPMSVTFFLSLLRRPPTLRPPDFLHCGSDVKKSVVLTSGLGKKRKLKEAGYYLRQCL